MNTHMNTTEAFEMAQSVEIGEETERGVVLARLTRIESCGGWVYLDAKPGEMIHAFDIRSPAGALLTKVPAVEIGWNL